MARRVHQLLQLLCLAAAVAAVCGSAGFRAELKHPYAGSALSAQEMVRHSARASRARLARLEATLARHLGNTSVPVAALADQAYTVTVGIGTPPQPQDLFIDTGSDLIWTQCALFRGTATLRQPPYDPDKSSTFAFLPCRSRLCREGYPGTKSCPNKTCLFDYGYGSAAGDGVLASDIFNFGKVSVELTFGCGNITGGDLLGASGLMGLSPAVMSLVSQENVDRFSYCLSPFADREARSHLFFGAMANLQGQIQTISILKNPVEEKASLFYYVPLVGLSLGSRRLAVLATSLELKPNGNGGTVVDSGSTTMSLVEPAFKTLKEAVLETVKLPVANSTVEDYEVCFSLPSGVPMGAVETPPLVLHFEGGADMILPQENYFQEPRPGLMCLAVGGSGFMSIIGNVQQQNLHVLLDVRKMKLSFARAQCDLM